MDELKVLDAQRFLYSVKAFLQLLKLFVVDNISRAEKSGFPWSSVDKADFVEEDLLELLVGDGQLSWPLCVRLEYVLKPRLHSLDALFDNHHHNDVFQGILSRDGLPRTYFPLNSILVLALVTVNVVERVLFVLLEKPVLKQSEILREVLVVKE